MFSLIVASSYCSLDANILFSSRPQRCTVLYVVCSKSSTGYVHSIFDFFVALCWYAYPSLVPTSSAISNVQLSFDSYFAWTCFGSSSIFASSVSGTRKSHRGQIWGIRWLQQHYCVVLGQKFAHK